ncbi:MAG TPA: PAS domain-containing sensor histidine kinase [Candidatus Limnocylindria bacterium]|nr:PAS domain-containing sensor histidine kinase [Candidatus Limnocylindria bacterium]
MTRRSVRNAILGAGLGGAAAWMSLWLASGTAQSAPVVVLAVLVITVVGLSLGAIPALVAYVVAGVILLVASLPPPGETMADPDVLRLMVFAFGSPVVIVLGLRSEWQQRADRAALQASNAAQELANEASLAADGARLQLRDALEQVDRERERLAEVAQAIPEPLIVYGADGLGTFANNAALRVFGRSFYDRPLDQWARVVEPRDEGGRPLAREEWPQLRARSGPVRSRVLVRLPMSGRDLLVEVEGTPLPDGGSVLLLRDVGKEVDERRRLSRFASFVAHELRNPLAVAKARIELANRGREAVRGVDHGARALESVDAAIGILERLELFSRAEAGRLEAGQEPFDLREAADAGIERLRAQGSEREVRVIAYGAPVVLGDRGLTEQAITNLLTNADRYSQPNAAVDVEIDGREAPLLRVRDAGPGIPDEVADVLFRERVSSGRGLGLGLFLVNAAMEAQGGSVRLEERRPRASFVLVWPRGAATGDGIEAEPATASA